jgi:tripartite-type tricarboxylate transporter receptor subunit TctC
MMTGVNMTHVPYRGSAPALTDMISGQVQVMFDNMPPSLPHIRAGKLRALAVGNAQRMPALPEFPTLAETGVPGYEAFSWAGLIAPAGTPREPVMRLNREMAQILGQKEIVEQLAKDGALAMPDTPEEFAAYIKSELGKWAAIVKLAQIKPE